MASYRYTVVDVFTTNALEGNPLAVFPDAAGLDDETMQRIALEFNLSETVFVLPPAAQGRVARLRIFTPRRELPFAGHPTIGTAHVLLSSGAANSDRFVVEELIGDVPIRVERDAATAPILWLTAPPVTFGDTVAPDVCARALGLETGDILAGASPQYATAGSPFLYAALRTPEAVDRARYDPSRLAVPAWDNVVGIFVFAPAHEDVEGFPAVYSRMFAPESGISEDPATGGATGPLAAYIIEHAVMPAASTRRFVSEQGVKMGRRSLLHVSVTHSTSGDRTIEVGGSVVDVATGTLTLPATRRTSRVPD
jgi:trans-2,3-dihydro-3-hydroxyanthranilate isomerase